MAAFDPNSADSINLQRGLSLYCTYYFCNTGEPAVNSGQRMIFSRVYGLSSEKFNMLKPYISDIRGFSAETGYICTLSKGGERYVGGL